MTQVVGCLPSNRKTLGTNPSSANKKKERKKDERKRKKERKKERKKGRKI
jgi:hypothetical protein